MSTAARTERIILLLSALMLPTLSLVPLGGMYLWEKGWLLAWALAALLVSVAVHLSQRWLLAPAPALAPTVTVAGSNGMREAKTAEDHAWEAIHHIAATVDLDKLDTIDAVLELGQRTIEAVARRLHPEKPDSIWQFTVPEALAIFERVSRRLGRFTVANIPFGDRLKVAHVLRAYSWRNLVDIAGRAYDVWRILRIANPATAATHEARERLSKAALDWGREHISRRLTQAYVEEVGRAAIDLYSGRLRIVPGAAAPVDEPLGDTERAEGVSVQPGVVGASRQAAAAIANAARALFNRRR